MYCVTRRQNHPVDRAPPIEYRAVPTGIAPQVRPQKIPNAALRRVDWLVAATYQRITRADDCPDGPYQSALGRSQYHLDDVFND